ncbi:hypothetical protein ACFLSF_04940, partial [Candidatus Bipolaricaulota bacterium]
REDIAYIVEGIRPINDGGYESYTIGLYAAAEMANESIRRVLTPAEGVFYVDALVLENELYLLSTEAQGARYVMRLEKTADLQQWETVVEFTAEAPASAFEFLDGFFYFGLGGAGPSSGGVYRMTDLP